MGKALGDGRPDPDPFAETPLSPTERQEMLGKLAEHIRPRVQALSDARSSRIRVLWEDLRGAETVESFQSAAGALLDALDRPESVGANEPVGPQPPSTHHEAEAGRNEGWLPTGKPAQTLGDSSPAPAGIPQGRGSTASLKTGIGIGAVVVALIGTAAIMIALQSGDSSAESAAGGGAARPVEYTPPASLTKELRDAGLSPAKFRQACEDQDYARLRWFQIRIGAPITCRFHAGVDVSTGLRAAPPPPHYRVSGASREKLRSEFGMVPSDIRPACLAIAREFRAGELRGANDGDTYWGIARSHHRSSVVSYIEGGDVFSGSRLDPCIRFAGLDPWGGAPPYFVANGTADSDRAGLSYTWT